MTSRLWLSHAVVEVSFLTKPGSQVSMASTHWIGRALRVERASAELLGVVPVRGRCRSTKDHDGDRRARRHDTRLGG